MAMILDPMAGQLQPCVLVQGCVEEAPHSVERGRSPNPKLDGTNAACVMEPTEVSPMWCAVAQRFQDEEVARASDIQQLTAHVDQVVASLSMQVAQALQAMDEAATALCHGAAQASEASKATEQINALRERMKRLESEQEDHQRHVMAVEKSVGELKAAQDSVHAEIGSQQNKAIQELQASLTTRLAEVEGDCQRLDGAVADVASLGLLAAQVARQGVSWPLAKPNGGILTPHCRHASEQTTLRQSKSTSPSADAVAIQCTSPRTGGSRPVSPRASSPRSGQPIHGGVCISTTQLGNTPKAVSCNTPRHSSPGLTVAPSDATARPSPTQALSRGRRLGGTIQGADSR